MDIARRALALRHRLPFSLRVRALPQGARPVAAFALALILGTAAERSSREDALRDWLSAHSPPRATWVYALGERGWRTVSDLTDSHRALRSLPVSFENVPSAWISADRRWLAVLQAQPGWIFRRGEGGVPPRSPSEWRRLGSGWTAFETALTETPPSERRVPRPKSPIPADPRALRY